MVYRQTTDCRLSLGAAVIFFTLLHTGFGKLEIGRMDSPVDGLLGHDVIIPCHFTGYRASPLDLSTVSVRWTLEEELVYLYNGGRRTQNRPGSDIPERGLVGGDAGLHIPNLQTSDEGEYTCFIIVTPEKATSKVTVRLSAKPTCTVSNSSLVMTPDTERSVTCYVSGFYPAGARVHWMRHSKTSSITSDLDNNTCPKTPVRNPNGTFHVRSVLTVTTRSIGEDGDVYSCVVGHRSLTEPLMCNVTLSVQRVADYMSYIIGIIFGILVVLILAVLVIIYITCYKKEPPRVSDISGCELIHKETTELFCPIMDFRPKNIHFTLYLQKGKEKTRVGDWSPGRTENDDTRLLQDSNLQLEPYIQPSKNRLFSCFCAVTITPDVHKHDGAELILEVHHDTLKDPVYKRLTLSVKAVPVLDPITSNQVSYNVGDSLELRCKIHSFHPQNISVTWNKEGEALPSTHNEAQMAGDGLFSMTSRVSATIQEEDFGKTFRCKVEHSGTRDTDEGVTWRLRRPAAPVLDPITSNQESYNVGDRLELRCKIHSFYPKYVYVIWYQERKALPLTKKQAQMASDGLFSMTSRVSATIQDEDFGKTFSCKVVHPGTSHTDKSVTWTLGRPGNQNQLMETIPEDGEIRV